LNLVQGDDGVVRVEKCMPKMKSHVNITETVKYRDV